MDELRAEIRGGLQAMGLSSDQSAEAADVIADDIDAHGRDSQFIDIAAEALGAYQKRAGQPGPVADVVRVWTTRGVTPGRHAKASEDVREAMPELAEALDRLAGEHPEHRGAFWHPPED